MQIAARCGVTVCIHAYADDLQVYASCSTSDQLTTTDRLLTCHNQFDEWISSNRLKLNVDKTEFVWLGTCQQLAKVIWTPLVIRDQSMPFQKVHDLSVILGGELTMEPRHERPAE